MGELINASLKGDYKKAKEMHYRLPSKVLFVETNPSPVKAAMDMMGLAAGNPRLPIVPVTKGTDDKIRKALEELDLV